jgi:type IV pilus assembly protein PilM
VEVGRDFIRLVELSYSRQKYRVQSCVNLDLPDSSDETVIRVVRNLLKERGIKTKQVVVALSSSVVTFKEVYVACGLSSEEEEKFLRFSLAKEMDLLEEEVVFDYQVGGVTDGLRSLQVVGVERKDVERQIQLFKEAKLHLQAIDIDIYAIEQAVRFQLPKIEKPMAVINIDRGRLLVLVLNDKKIIDTYEEYINIDESKAWDPIYAKLPQPIDQIVLSGRKDKLFGLIRSINDQLNIKIIIAYPFLNMEFSQDVSSEKIQEMAPLMLVSCGLALRVGDA